MQNTSMFLMPAGKELPPSAVAMRVVRSRFAEHLRRRGYTYLCPVNDTENFCVIAIPFIKLKGKVLFFFRDKRGMGGLVNRWGQCDASQNGTRVALKPLVWKTSRGQSWQAGASWDTAAKSALFDE